MPDTTQETTLHRLPSKAVLVAFANTLADTLQPGDLITLDGPLGAGKTTLTQAIADALGVTEPVTSPSFVLINDYQSGRIPMLHADLYRLGEDGAGRLKAELLEAVQSGEVLMIVEWACYGDYLTPFATHRIAIDYDPDNPEGRLLTLTAGQTL